jgi:Ca2+-binding EF-hand superfamily protein
MPTPTRLRWVSSSIFLIYHLGVMTELQKAKQIHYFNVLDYNGDGVLEKQDFVNIADRLADMRDYEEGSSRHTAVRQEILRMWTNARALSGKEGKTEITLEDWLAHEQKVLDSNVLIHSYVQGIARAIFDILDEDNDGVISKKEYLKFFRSFRGNEEDAEIAFRKLDENDNGYLTRKSFLEAVTEFHLSDDPEARGNWLFGPYQKEAGSSA